MAPLLRILPWASVAAIRQHLSTAILSSHSHSLSLSLATCQRITFSLSRPPSWVFWCYFSSLPATAAHNKHSQPVCLRLLSYSLATLCICLFIYLYFWEKSSKKHTVSPCTLLFVAFFKYLHIALMSPWRVVPCNRSLQTLLGPAQLQRAVWNHYCNWGLLPTWIALDISKPCGLIMGMNGLDFGRGSV